MPVELGVQLNLPPSLTIQVPERDATLSEQRQKILHYLKFAKFDDAAKMRLQKWLDKQASQGIFPDELYQRAEKQLLQECVVLPGQSVLKRLSVKVCTDTHERIFNALYLELPSSFKQAINGLLTIQSDEHHTLFYNLKEFPPSATITSIQDYLYRYHQLNDTGIEESAMDQLVRSSRYKF